MLLFETCFVAFFVLLIAGRFISNRALAQLSAEQKVALLDAFAGMRMYSLIPMVAIMVAYFVLIRHPVMSFRLLTALYLGVFVVYIGWSYWYTRRRLLRLELPGSYMTRIGIARALRLVGLALLLVSLPSFGIF